MTALSHRITALDESATIKMAQLSRDLKAKGHDIIDLSLGEPDFDTPEHIREAAKLAIDTGYSHYTPVAGYPDVRQAISRKFERENGLQYDAAQIVISNGAKQSIINTVLCLVNPGDEVILPAPYWVSYKAMVQLAEGEPVVLPTTISSDFKITPEQLQAAITPKTKLMIFSSPCNPTGSVYTRSELEALAAVILQYPDLYVISDEIYEHINFMGKHASMASVSGMYERTITVNGLSKAYAMTGWRLGYLGAPLDVAKAVDKMQGQYTSAANSITQRAVIAALEGSEEPLRNMQAAFLQRRDLVLSLLKHIDGLKYNIPQGAFYFFPDVTAYFGRSFGHHQITDADALCMYLIEIGGVSVVTGSAFGDPNCIRLSYATSEEVLKEAIRRMEKALEQLT
ncbi:MAG TPA: pyridoxal phosphate-dependent aminotransferase [Chitinophagales bacterium]|nr:pyridoxal phosphate-dependent aminotransferase [Chitinophagales bacterium]